MLLLVLPFILVQPCEHGQGVLLSVDGLPRLRARLRHEHQSIAMALAAALHHSAGP